MKTFTLLKSLLIACLFSLMGGEICAFAQETLYSETFGKGSSTATVLNEYKGFSNSLVSPVSGDWKVNNKAACDLEGSSKEANMFVIASNTVEYGVVFNFGNKFKGCTNVKISFNYQKGSGKNKATDLGLYFSGDGGENYGNNLFPSNTGTGGTWYSTGEISIPSEYLNNFVLKIGTVKASAANLYRVDDIVITGIRPQATTGNFTITSAGYATYFTDKAFTMPEGVTGSIITDVNNGSLTIEDKYLAGSVVPASTALLLKGAEKEYTYDVVTTTETAPTNNMLYGSTFDTETMVGSDLAGYLFYMLSYNDAGDKLGFYWATENGDSFKSDANKAWLAVPTSSGNSQLKGFALDGTTTGIQQATLTNTVSPIFDINGRRVNTLNGAAKGVYIVGGKKVMVK